MFRRTFTVSYSPLKNNYVLLPDNYYRVVSAYRNGCLSISHSNLLGNHHISWTPYGVNYKDDEIGINPQVAQAAGLKEGDVVNVSMIIEARSLKKAEVSAVSEKDWEMLEISSHKIQSTLLEQTRIINKGQVLVVWINDSISIKIKIDFLLPTMPYGRLENDTELIVTPFKRTPAKKEVTKEPELSGLAKSSTNSSLAELVRQRKLTRTKTADLSEILQNGTTDPLKKRPASVYAEAETNGKSKNHEKSASPLLTKSSIRSAMFSDKSPEAPEQFSPLRRNKTAHNSIFDRVKDDPVPKLQASKSVEREEGPLKRNNSVKNSMFNRVVDNHLTKLQTSKSVADFLCEKSGEDESKYKNKNEYIEDLIATLNREVTKSYEFRVISGKWDEKSVSQICDVFITKNNLFPDIDPHQCFLLTTNDNKEYYVNLKIVHDSGKFPNNIYNTIEINEKLRNLLDINECEKVTLKPKLSALNIVDKIELIPCTKALPNIRKDIEEKFKEYILNNSKLYPVILNQNQVFKLLDYYFTVKLEPEILKFCLINSKILRESKILCTDNVKNVDACLKSGEDDEKNGEDGAKKAITVGKYEKIVDDCVDRLKLKLCLDERSACRKTENILLAGPTNSGKRSICIKIMESLKEAPYFCYSNTFHCSKHKGRKPESIQKELRHQFYLCMFHNPAIIFLENLDILTHHTPDQNTQDGEYHSKISDIFRNTIEEFTMSNPISVIATVSNVSNLNKRIYSSRGHHIFNHIIKIPDLDKTDREIVIKKLCSNKKCKIDRKLNWKKFTNLTEGYTIGNLVQFIDRAVFYTFKKNAKTPLLTDEMLSSSLEVTNSFCLQGIENNKKTNSLDEENDDDVPGDQIPGLENAIDVFQEVLMWPTRFPKVFENSPLRNQAGILLFGPPGTGKTYLVSKLSKSWNLRMISVKGPELLAKYIGQSEENVRNLFDRARSAKPCVLFFDEFDSLAPRRGHDSTGVTDRVVNQLLTELDGVEGLHGVTVIGATSRPELLDPALLRSGRIDRLVECFLPDAGARLGILKNLSKSLHLDKSVDLKYFASKSSNYTGADIQSILTSANMIAVQECLDRDSENVPDKIYITQQHLSEAFDSTRPSLSAFDIAKYKTKYARFTNKETATDFVAQRTTLA